MKTVSTKPRVNPGTAGNRKFVDRRVADIGTPYSERRLDNLLENLQKNDRSRSIEAALRSHFYAEAVTTPERF